MAEGFTDVNGNWVPTFEGFRIDELEGTLGLYNKTSPDLFAEWLNPRYNNDAPALQKKLAMAKKYQLIKSGFKGEEDYKKRLQTTAELEAMPMRPSAATTLLGVSKGQTDSLLTKTLLGA